MLWIRPVQMGKNAWQQITWGSGCGGSPWWGVLGLSELLEGEGDTRMGRSPWECVYSYPVSDFATQKAAYYHVHCFTCCLLNSEIWTSLHISACSTSLLFFWLRGAYCVNAHSILGSCPSSAPASGYVHLYGMRGLDQWTCVLGSTARFLFIEAGLSLFMYSTLALICMSLTIFVFFLAMHSSFAMKCLCMCFSIKLFLIFLIFSSSSVFLYLSGEAYSSVTGFEICLFIMYFV